MTRFRPGWRWRLLAYVGAGSALFGGVGLAHFALVGEVWLWGLGAPLLAAGAVMAWRIPTVGAEFDETQVIVRGLLWSRTIPWDDLEDIVTELQFAAVVWRTADGRRVVTPITAVQPGRLNWLPYRSTKRRRAFMAALDRWSYDNHQMQRCAEPGSRSRPGSQALPLSNGCGAVEGPDQSVAP
ncbi:hypothetical protein AB0870_08985 [Microbacterium proteolyticum]|uniref:hypothetical protein n=1 Tax=Microbacterium proteolyticum TaxID=1572644 RepID=UPI002415B043|nr:hypothetical protein [Microbacterium proteolyticum]